MSGAYASRVPGCGVRWPEAYLPFLRGLVSLAVQLTEVAPRRRHRVQLRRPVPQHAFRERRHHGRERDRTDVHMRQRRERDRAPRYAIPAVSHDIRCGRD